MLGQVVSHYRILEKLGSGGMGVVYLAEDLRLNRKVAVKFLPEESGLDQTAIERFGREARAASALNHPNICTVYDVGEVQRRPFLVMELLEGHTLRSRLQQGPLPPGETLDIALQLVDALAVAHATGILHRDIKPANLFLTVRGQAKILDFGLAKRMGAAAKPEACTETRTLSVEITNPGSVLGTLAYMSPEQARGQELDARGDLFSFGVVLYEMLTGTRPFAGQSPAALAEAILNAIPERPSWRNSAIPAQWDAIILKLVEKDRALRYQSAPDLCADLKSLRDREAKRAGRRHAWLWSAVAAFGAGALVLYWVSGSRNAAPSLAGATFTQLTSDPGEESFPSISPDGKSVVYSMIAQAAPGNQRTPNIFLLRVGGRNSINLTHDAFTNTEPAFSPDGERIAFRSSRDGGGIFIMGAMGESVRRATNFGHTPTWSPDGKRLAFATETVDTPATRPATSRLWVADIATGDKKQLTQSDAIQPSWSPHGHRIAYAGSQAGRRHIWTIPAEGGEPLPVTSDKDVDWNPVWSPEGRQLYFASDRGGRMNLWRLPIDEQSGKVLGPPEPVTTPSPYSAHISISRDGKRIVYVQWVKTDRIQKVAFDPDSGQLAGEPAPITQSTRPAFFPDPSPDGQWLTFCSNERPEDIFVIKTDGSGLRQLTDDDYIDRFPRWSPDGAWIAFMSDRSGAYQIWVIHPDGSALRQITYEPAGVVAGAVWSPDSTHLIYNRSGDVPRIVDFRKNWNEQTPESLPAYDGKQYWARSWSPDSSMITGFPPLNYSRIVLYFVKDHRYLQVEEHGGHSFWFRDSRRLLFDDQNELHVLNIQTRQRYKVLSVTPYQLNSRSSISPDNRTIYYGIHTSESDVWLMSLK